MNFRIQIEYEGKLITTLRDILPDKLMCLRMLIIGKRPALVSVEKRYYLQGRQGKMFWKYLSEYGLLNVTVGKYANEEKYEDEELLNHGFGITDIVKVPGEAGTEPSNAEYRTGIDRVKEVIKEYSPSIVLFVYKGALDAWLKLVCGRKSKSIYGFNYDLEALFGRKVFVFPMPGTPCKKEEAHRAMQELANVMRVQRKPS